MTDLQESGTVCTTWGCSNRAESMVSCEGEGTFPYCRECAETLLSGGETRQGTVDDPVVADRDRYCAALVEIKLVAGGKWVARQDEAFGDILTIAEEALR